MFFGKHTFFRSGLILVFLSGVFGSQATYSVHAFEESRNRVAAAQRQTTTAATNIPLVSLTFDDGSQSIYDNAFPILNARGVPGTLYFISDWLTESWKVQLRDLQNHGWEIGSHTVTHTPLDTLTLEQVDEELRQSKADLEAAGLRITGFAYPYGIGHQYPEIVQLTAQYYRYARSVHPGYNQVPVSPYVLLAQAQDSSVSLATMKGWVDTAIATNRWLIILMHQVDDTGGMFSITPADLTALASYIKTKVDAGSLQAVTVQQGFDLYTGSTPACYPLTLSHSGQGSNPTATPVKSAACSTNGQYVYGEAINLSGAAPSAGWQISGWTGTSNDGRTFATNSLSMPAGARTVSVNYSQIEYSLAITSPHGPVTKMPDQASYHYGDIVELTVRPAHDWLFTGWSGDATGSTNPLSVTMDGDKSITADFMRSGADTTGVFRPGNGLLYLKNKNETGFADVALNYGLPGDYPVVGDWDGNGTVTIGIYRQGYFYLRNSNTIGFAEVVFPFGQPGDQPVAGDWNGDGLDTIGTFRSSNGQFLLRDSNSEGPAEMSFFLGNPGDVGLAGDWNGDGVDTTGVFRPSNGLIYLKDQNTSGFADYALNYGLPGDQPVMGDWDNDGIDTIGIYRSGLFYLRNSNMIGFAEVIFGLGNPGDMPIAGNWDGIP